MISVSKLKLVNDQFIFHLLSLKHSAWGLLGLNYRKDKFIFHFCTLRKHVSSTTRRLHVTGTLIRKIYTVKYIISPIL
jgi:hypothetical protein